MEVVASSSCAATAYSRQGPIRPVVGFKSSQTPWVQPSQKPCLIQERLAVRVANLVVTEESLLFTLVMVFVYTAVLSEHCCCIACICERYPQRLSTHDGFTCMLIGGGTCCTSCMCGWLHEEAVRKDLL